MAIISLLTDAPNYNLALMKLSTWHKLQGDEVYLNTPLIKADKTYASILFSWNKKNFIADEYGGIQFPEVMLPKHIEMQKPDYDLYKLDHSLGYTFRPCYRRCDFCLVKTLKQPDQRHHSIWEFHDKKFDKICLMNNNTFLDPKWKDTFEEIWAAKLKVLEHGFDVRLIDEEKANAIKKTSFVGHRHFAWDRMKDEKKITSGLKFLYAAGIKECRFYVLAGYDTTWEEDIYRCQIIVGYSNTPYIMPFNKTRTVKLTKNFINSPANWWHKRDNLKAAFKDWLKGNKSKKPASAEEDKQMNLL